MLTINNLTIERGGKVLLNKVSAFLGENEKIGIVGLNGAGKSSLLKTIINETEANSGEIFIQGEYGYLAQEVHMQIGTEENKEKTIEEYLVIDQNLNVEPWEISRFLGYLNLEDKTPDSIINTLSGGQKVKVELVKLLLQEPDLLILDEPTNFLDIPTAEWLMRYLQDYKKALLIISHDLRMMDKGIDRIWYLNERTQKIESYKGNYTKFLAYKEQQEAGLVKQILANEKKEKKMMRSAAYIAKNKGDKSKMKAAKVRERARELKEKTEGMKSGLTKSKKINFNFQQKFSPGKRILEVRSVAKQFDQPVLKNIGFEVMRGEKIVIIGKNGAGKSTLLKILMGIHDADMGEYKWGYNVDIGYYAQEYEGIDPEMTVLENMEADKRFVDMGIKQVRTILGSFLFGNDRINQKVKTLSGGEKTRLAMAKIVAGGYNVLLLDEPTTYLDPISQEILIEAIKQFEGTLILVSHLPELVTNIDPDKALLMPEETFTYYDEEMLSRVGIS